MAKSLALNEIRVRASRFVTDWRDAEGYERGEAQSFVRDLLAVYGITATRAGLYEVRATRASTASRGYIDALVPGLAAVEMKSAGGDLEAAENQALDYLHSLSDAEMPRWVITSDFRRFRLLDLEAASESPGQAVSEFALEELPLRAEEMAFFAGYSVRRFGSAEQERASIRAARLMAGLWEELEGSGYEDHEASVFMVRTLFALYADDAGVWERDLFQEFLATRTAEDGSDLGSQLTHLYETMARASDRRQRNLDELVGRFPYVNGGLFDESLAIPSFTASMRDRLLQACRFNWSAISPAIFGSLFQAVKDREARRELGEHYTTESNILKVIGPMFLDELNQRFADSANDVTALRRLRAHMGSMRFLDPACGCGNFLVIAYREMRALDLRVLERLQQLGSREHRSTLLFDTDDLPVTLRNFHGIELEEWPARIATTALHLVEHQANQAMELALGQGPQTLPLTKVETIHVGNALRLDWAAVIEPSAHLYILGNPPFLGHATRSTDQAADLRRVWQRSDIGRLDYVTGWYAKALELLSRPGYDGQFAFVSTNSITQGEPVPALFGPLFRAGWRIKFAHRTFAWTSEAPGAAAVHCVALGFDRHARKDAWLYEYQSARGDAARLPVKDRINAYLVDGPNVLVEQRLVPLSESLPKMVFGNMPRDGGHLIVEPADYEVVRGDAIAAKYLRPYVGARELIRGEQRWCLWLADLDPSDLDQSRLLRDRVSRVREFRRASSASSTRGMAQTPHLFGQRSHKDVPHLVVPRVSSASRAFLPCGHFGGEVIVSDSNFAAEDSDGFAFGIVSSSMFMAWQRTVGGRLKSDLRFSGTLTWNTFPLARTADSTREAIIAAGQSVLEARALHPGRSLAQHYNPLGMTPEVLQAHRKLDAAVDRAFGMKSPGDEVSRLRVLFASYARLVSSDQLSF